MLTIINSFLGAILTMGMDSAQSYYFFEQAKKGRDAQACVVTSILQWRLTWGVGIVVLAMLLSPLINAMFFKGSLSWKYFAIAFSGGLFAQLMNQSAEVFRLLYRPWNYIGITLGNVIVSAGIAVTLVVWLDYGILGYFVGIGSGSLVAALFGWWAIHPYLDFSTWHRVWWPRLLRFGAPLVPASIGMYVMNTSDRWFIIHYHGEHALGIYAVGVKFAVLIGIMVNAFRSSWRPIVMNILHSSDDTKFFCTVAQLYMGLGTASIVVFTALSPVLLHCLTVPNYYSAYPIMSIISWSLIFYGFFMFGAVSMWKRGKTEWVFISIVLAALLNIALNALFVPQWGGVGAAIATSISFFVWNIIVLSVSKILWPIGYPLGILGFQVGIGVTASVSILLLFAHNQEVWKVCMVTIVAMAFLIGSSADRNHLKWFRGYLKSRITGEGL